MARSKGLKKKDRRTSEEARWRGLPPPPLREAYRAMRARFGHQGWWPGETPFEICVGAVLTQNTNWGNVERAIARLKAADLLSPQALYAAEFDRIAEAVRPAGYFRIKTKRLKAFVRVLVEEHGGNLERLFAGPVEEARQRLLAVQGIGPETADSMLLYAGGRMSFVVDAYTRRIFERHEWAPRGADYETVRAICSGALRRRDSDRQLDLWQDCHAQFVAVGKHFCRPRDPKCEACPLAEFLPRRKAAGKAAGGSR